MFFVKNILTIWFRLKEQPQEINDVKRQGLWKNEFIEIDNVTIVTKFYMSKD